jgi:hypothetical protein
MGVVDPHVLLEMGELEQEEIDLGGKEAAFWS